MSHLFPTYNRLDIELVSGKGTVVQDQNGKSYLDFISGIAVCNLGHSPSVVKKMLQIYPTILLFLFCTMPLFFGLTILRPPFYLSYLDLRYLLMFVQN